MFDLLLATLLSMSKIPGLRFLENLSIELKTKQGRIEQTKGDYEAKFGDAVGGVKSIKNFSKNAKGSKKKR